MRVEHETPPVGHIATPEQLAGRLLASLRKERGWSQAEVARRMRPYGYSWVQSTVGRIESGERPLRLNELVHVAAMFGVSPLQLLVPNVTPARLEEDIRASEDGRSQVAKQLAEAKAELDNASAHRAGAEERYQRLMRELERADMHLAALRGLDDLLARQGSDDA
jgi:transcriptional regulator with XRE-family HTH domain